MKCHSGWLSPHTRLAGAIVVPAKVQKEKEMDFYKADVVALFEKKKYKAPTIVAITSNMLRLTVNVINTSAEPNLVWTSFLAVKSCSCIHPINNTFLKSASQQPCQCRRQSFAFGSSGWSTCACRFQRRGKFCSTAIHWRDSHRKVCNGKIPFGTPYRPQSLSPSPNYLRIHTPSDPLAVLRSEFDVETNTYHWQDHIEGQYYFERKVRGDLLKIKASGTGTTSSMELVYRALDPNWMWNGMFLPVSGILIVQFNVLTKITVTNVSKKPATLLRGILIGGETDLLESLSTRTKSQQSPKRGKRKIILSQTLSQPKSTKRVTWLPHWQTQKSLEVHDNALNADWRDRVITEAKYAENYQKTLDKIAEF